MSNLISLQNQKPSQTPQRDGGWTHWLYKKQMEVLERTAQEFLKPAFLSTGFKNKLDCKQAYAKTTLVLNSFVMSSVSSESVLIQPDVHFVI